MSHVKPVSLHNSAVHNIILHTRIMMEPSVDASTSVRVGVRVRPLTDQEKGHGGKSALNASHPEIRLGERRFTYDNVFDESLSQEDLYHSVSGSLLTSFLGGYNATIMAYGQTGSGKTFTMGSEAQEDLNIGYTTGLIPRFMSSVFSSLEQKKLASDISEESPNSLVEFDLQASFLEVYGEDVHDLLDPSRKPLPLREDATGGIVCSGLTHRPVNTAQESLQVLHEGTHNRTTAATLMNLTSSRSHAVFTITLQQKFSRDGLITSRFTFVDLAGSERMKKTGAQGERAREGIQINKGLLALGNVINALASEEKPHVPYRQSKLTRLLQDALGGNSQTLFLACVSPSDTNASETLSTLHYANRARNIKNAPVQNVDGAAMELLRAKSLAALLQTELLRHKYGQTESEETLLQRADVKAYLNDIQSKATKELGNITVPFSNEGVAPSLHQLTSPRRPKRAKLDPSNPPSTKAMADNDKSILENFDSSALDEVNPDEEMAILDQLLQLQQRDHDFGAEQAEGAAELEKVEGELAEQEVMLLQLRESLKVYHDIKVKYENLMAEVGQLEKEKLQLAQQLEKANTDPTQGCTKLIQRKLENVEKSLARARDESHKHRMKVRQVEQEAKKTHVLERKISELKVGRANLVKNQKQAAKTHREYTERHTREISALRRQRGVAEKKLSKLQSTISAHKRNLNKRQTYIDKLAKKLKETEAHLMKLLSMRNRALRNRKKGTGGVTEDTIGTRFGPINQEIKSLLFLLDKATSDEVLAVEVHKEYEVRVNEYSQVMRDLVRNVQSLEDAKGKLKADDSGQNQALVEELEQSVEAIELKTEILSSDLADLQRQIEEADNRQADPAKRIVSDKSVATLQMVVVEMFSKQVALQCERNLFAADAERKESTARSLENEVDMLQRNVQSLRTELSAKQSKDSIEKLKSEKVKLKEELSSSKCEVQTLRGDLEDATLKLHHAASDVLSTKERLALIEVSLSQSDGVHVPTEVLHRVQTVWNELGSSTQVRNQLHRDIENCLQDTCERKLEEATALLDTTKHNVQHLQSELSVMYRSLEREPVDCSSSQNMGLLSMLESLHREKSDIMPLFEEARRRRDDMADQTNEFIRSMELEKDDLPCGLQNLLEDSSKFPPSVKSHNVQYQRLAPSFLEKCGKDIKSLRLRRSEDLARNSQIHQHCNCLIMKMNLKEDECLSILEQHAKLHTTGSASSCWSDSFAKTVVAAACCKGGIIRTTPTFTEHLTIFLASLKSVAQVREDLSTSLQGVIDRAKKCLLATVGSEVDAADAYSNYHKVIVEQPELSRDRILACVSEIKSLVPGVEAMIQSEVEALMVVWEALNVQSTEQGTFWERVDGGLIAASEKNTDLVEIFHQKTPFETDKWVLDAAHGVSEPFSQLETCLYKLDQVHKEVEKLRARQDKKSMIISLDSEIRILSAQLGEFEDKQCNKQRLLSKKTCSSNLLKEERFRKQMQGKFSSKLEHLASQLSSWEKVEGSHFESDLLSGEVSCLLNLDGSKKNWVEKRTEFMHLRTVKPAASAKKSVHAPLDTTPSRPRKRHNLTNLPKTANPPVKMTPSKTTKRRRNGEVNDNGKKRKTLHAEENNAPNPVRLVKVRRVTRSTFRASENKMPLSPLKQQDHPPAKNTNKRLTLAPFGRVLRAALSPEPNRRTSTFAFPDSPDAT